MAAKPLEQATTAPVTAGFSRAVRGAVLGHDLTGVVTRAMLVAAVAPVMVVAFAAGFSGSQAVMALALALAAGATMARLVAIVALGRVKTAVAASLHIAETGATLRVPTSWLSEANELSSAVNGIVARFGETTRRLQRQALHDSLTGLPNREHFLNRLTGALRNARHDASPLAVMFLDVDDFKSLNDTMGHGAGDALLMAFSQRIRNAIRGHHIVARLGGDEFAVIVDSAAAETDAREIAGRLQQALGRPFSIGDRQVRVTTSIGIAVTVTRAVSATELLRVADVGLYQAKGRGKARYAVLRADPPAGPRRIAG
ncbi:MAG: GGDEF domain-containing protein [Dehalococcoidia bacterium]|nr:GGDEF domain-containing protein [Dehalococcoidia bacterium]